MINKEQNTYFSSLLSQKKKWDIDAIIALVNRLLEPFEGLDDLEPSEDVSMLEYIGIELSYKIGCYKAIIDRLYENNGMECSELSINSFNDYCGVDIISFIYMLISKGYELDNIKSVRLFHQNRKSLQRALLLCKSIFPTIKIEAFDLSITGVKDETICDSILTVNLFPHTLKLNKGIQKVIAKLIIKSHLIYSHSVFLENIDFADNITTVDCNYYWQDVNMCRFVRNDSKNYTYNQTTTNGLRKLAFSIFSNTSINTLDIKHNYNIVLPNLCPGISRKKMFNEEQRILFFDRPFEGMGDNLAGYDDTETIYTGLNYDDINHFEAPLNYTLRGMIVQFPQYVIQEGLEKNENWAKTIYEHYYNEAKQGNYACYNCLAVLELLSNSMSDDYMDVTSDNNKKIIELLENAIKGDDVNAMINLASFYAARGLHHESIKLYEIASKHKSDVGAYSMGIVYDMGLYDYMENHSKAISYYKEALLYHSLENNTNCCSSFSESNCCLNLILLMYKEKYSLCEIYKEYIKIKKPSKDLVYAFTVISNNLSNKAKDFFKILGLKENLNEGASHVKFNRLIALYNGVKNGKDELKSNKELALRLLEDLADSKCTDWPDWEQYVWRTLANWYDEVNASSAKSCTYWIKAGIANTDNMCAFQTNIAIAKQLSADENKDIWHKYAYGEGCAVCHECSNYDSVRKCCPKAQFTWAKEYEKDKQISQHLIKVAANQEYLRAWEQLAIYDVIEKEASEFKITTYDNFALRVGVLSQNVKSIIHLYNEDSKYKYLEKAVDLGSKKAAAILAEVIHDKNRPYEFYFLKGVLSNVVEKFEILKEISGKTLDGDYFQPSSLAEYDLLYIANLIAEQYIGGDNAFNYLKSLAEFYVKGENYSKAISLYKIAKEKGNDVADRISYLEDILEQEKRQYQRDYYDDYNDYDGHDYARDTWDAMTDGMYGDMPDGFDGDFSFLGY